MLTDPSLPLNENLILSLALYLMIEAMDYLKNKATGILIRASCWTNMFKRVNATMPEIY